MSHDFSISSVAYHMTRMCRYCVFAYQYALLLQYGANPRMYPESTLSKIAL